MQQAQPVVVTGRDGFRGVLEGRDQGGGAGAADGLARIRLDDGESVTLPAELLQSQPDGSLTTFLSRADLERAAVGEGSLGEVVVPVVEEQLEVSKRNRPTGQVVVWVEPGQREERVDVDLARERVEVERVPIDRVVGSAPPVRQEGDVTVVPVVEEVLVVRKELRLKEEIRLTRRREVKHEQRTVTLRTEQARVLREQPKQPD